LAILLAGCSSPQNEFVAAVANGDTSAVKRFIAEGRSLEETETWHPWGGDRPVPGRTPLTQAAAYNRVDIGKLLVDAGADLETCDGFGQTALLAAVANNHKEFTAFLLDAGADANALCRSVGYPMILTTTSTEYAFMYKNTDILRLLLKHGATLHRDFRANGSYLSDEKFRVAVDRLLEEMEPQHSRPSTRK
jgi:uncharacterized protein